MYVCMCNIHVCKFFYELVYFNVQLFNFIIAVLLFNLSCIFIFLLSHFIFSHINGLEKVM